MTVAQMIREKERETRKAEILKAFNTITREEVLAMLEKFIELGIITVVETKTKVNVQLHRSCTSHHFIDVLNELDRTCERYTSHTNKNWQNVNTYKITDALVQVTFC